MITLDLNEAKALIYYIYGERGITMNPSFASAMRKLADGTNANPDTALPLRSVGCGGTRCRMGTCDLCT